MNLARSKSPAPRRPRNRLALVALTGTLMLAAAAAPANGAVDWAKHKTATTKRLLDVAFANANVGVTVGQGGIILGTMDGGGTWGTRVSPVTSDLRGATAANACMTQGGQPCFWAAAANGSVLMSKDGGATWCVQQTGITERLTGIRSVNADEVVAVGANGTVIRSTTARECGAGAAYTAVTSGVTRNLTAVTTAPDGSTVVVGAAGTILRQVGTGPFQVVTSGTDKDFDGIATGRGSGNGYTLYAVGEAGTVLAS
ncbi:MAG TPA: YCF48-related protein, partial [Acidimicrobiia bacterium]|nr:YCF48-related protein [Acidimicrobiia bacterium]